VESYSLAIHLKLERGQLFSGLTLESGAWKTILWSHTRNWSVESYSLALHSKLERGKLFSGLILETGAWKAIPGLTLETVAWKIILWT
jgi:hypothetical protein